LLEHQWLYLIFGASIILALVAHTRSLNFFTVAMTLWDSKSGWVWSPGLCGRFTTP